MTPRRRKQLVAAGAGALVLAIVLAAVLAGGGGSGGSHSISVPAAQSPTGTTDPHAHDRSQITALALAYQRALGPTTNACSYLDPQSRAFAIAKAKSTYPGGPAPCWIAAQDLSGDAGSLSPPGIDPATLQFGQPSQQVRCVDQHSPPVRLPASQHGLPWAIAGWAGANGLQVTFVRENSRWWIDLLLCHA